MSDQAENGLIKRREAYRELFLDGGGGLTPHGEVVLEHILAVGSIGAALPTGAGAAIDPFALAKAEGKRELALAIVRLIFPTTRDSEMWRQIYERRYHGPGRSGGDKPAGGGRLV